MSSRLTQRLTFRLERLLVRGTGYRLLLVAAGLGLISVLAGAAVLWAGSGFGNFGEAVWWAFLRLTDPGYLGDDVGAVNRVVSTVVTVLGYVVFLGALVAILTQWLDERVERLESGLTPVAGEGHVVVLGWTNRTEAIVRELLTSTGRTERFLRRVGARGLHVVVLARTVNAALRQDLSAALSEVWDEYRVTLRSGTPLRPEHLERVDAVNASAVIIPASQLGGAADRTDTHTLKSLLSLGRGGTPDGGLPYVVAELLETDKALLAEEIYPGEIEAVRSHAVVSRLMAQNVRNAGLSHVYNQLLSHGRGADVFIREAGRLAGRTIADARRHFRRSILLGVVRPDAGTLSSVLNPGPGFEIQPDHRLVLLAWDYDETEPREPPEDGAPAPGEPAVAQSDLAAGTGAPAPREQPAEPTRVLLLGWNHTVPALLEEFGSYDGERFDVTDVSLLPVEDRRHRLRHLSQTEHVTLRHVQADITNLAELAALRPDEYDVALVLGSDRLDTSDESDARTVVGALLLDEVLRGSDRRPARIVELLDPDNVRLLGGEDAEVIISPLIVSSMLAQVALRRELISVFEELFTAGGAEIAFRPSADYVPGEEATFDAIQKAARRRGETALGVRRLTPSPTLDLAPEIDARFRPGPDLEVVTLVGSREAR